MRWAHWAGGSMARDSIPTACILRYTLIKHLPITILLRFGPFGATLAIMAVYFNIRNGPLRLSQSGGDRGGDPGKGGRPGGVPDPPVMGRVWRLVQGSGFPFPASCRKLGINQYSYGEINSLNNGARCRRNPSHRGMR